MKAAKMVVEMDYLSAELMALQLVGLKVGALVETMDN